MSLIDTIKNKIPKSVLDKIQNSSHVPVALLVLGITSAYHFKTGHDLGANYTNSLYAFYGFLGAHFTASQVWPDKDGGDRQ